MRKTVLKLLLIFLIGLILTACGNIRDNIDDNITKEHLIKTAKEIALDKIIKYAQTDGTSIAPTIKDYKVANIIGIESEEKLKKINEVVSKLTKEDVDTDQEIQRLEERLEEDIDTIKPVITIKGNSIINLTVGDSYTDLGATANDNVDGDITANINVVSNVDTSKEGIYRVKYSVSDSAGNRTEVVRIVKVIIQTSNNFNDKKWPKHLRGINIASPQKLFESVEPYEKMANWGVNAITINFGHDSGLGISKVEADRSPAVPKNLTAYQGGLDRLDKIIKLAKKYNISVIIQTADALGKDGLNIATDETIQENIEQEKKYIQNVIELTSYIAKKYENEPAVLAYGFIFEPHTTWIVDNWSSIVVPKFISAIRKVDMNSYLVISAGLWGFPDFGSSKKGRIKKPVDDPANKIVYGWHDYAPHNYTHQGIGSRPRGFTYPGMLKMFNKTQEKYWDRKELLNYIKPALNFMEKYKVKMFVSEFSVVRWAPGAAQLLDDKISIFEEFGIDWTCFSYGGKWDGWNLTVNKNEPGGNIVDGHENTDRLEVVKKYLSNNR